MSFNWPNWKYPKVAGTRSESLLPSALLLFGSLLSRIPKSVLTSDRLQFFHFFSDRLRSIRQDGIRTRLSGSRPEEWAKILLLSVRFHVWAACAFPAARTAGIIRASSLTPDSQFSQKRENELKSEQYNASIFSPSVNRMFLDSSLHQLLECACDQRLRFKSVTPSQHIAQSRDGHSTDRSKDVDSPTSTPPPTKEEWWVSVTVEALAVHVLSELSKESLFGHSMIAELLSEYGNVFRDRPNDGTPLDERIRVNNNTEIDNKINRNPTLRSNDVEVEDFKSMLRSLSICWKIRSLGKSQTPHSNF